VRHMQFNDAKSRGKTVLCGENELSGHLVHILARHLSRHRVFIVERDGAGPNGLPPAIGNIDFPTSLPRRLGGCLAPGVRKLNGGYGPWPSMNLAIGANACP